MRKIRFISLCVFILSLMVVPKSAAEKLTLTTFYPAPSGIYDRIQLAPREEMEDNCMVGTLYVNNENNFLYYCRPSKDGEEGKWSELVLIGAVQRINQELIYMSEDIEDVDTRHQTSINSIVEVVNSLADSVEKMQDDYDLALATMQKKMDEQARLIKRLEIILGNSRN